MVTVELLKSDSIEIKFKNSNYNIHELLLITSRWWLKPLLYWVIYQRERIGTSLRRCSQQDLVVYGMIHVFFKLNTTLLAMYIWMFVKIKTVLTHTPWVTMISFITLGAFSSITGALFFFRLRVIISCLSFVIL